MKIRIHEIEIGAGAPATEKQFFQTLGLSPALEEARLTVFNAGVKGLDFNVADHLPNGVVQISLLTDDLKQVMQVLTDNGTAFEGPFESHLAMLSVRLHSPSGINIIINTPTDGSPDWLKAW